MTENEPTPSPLMPAGPALVHGPVRIEMADGSVVESDRSMVA